MKVFQLTEADIIRASLDESEIGKWCFVVSGTFFGFFNTKEQAEEYLRKVYSHA